MLFEPTAALGQTTRLDDVKKSSNEPKVTWLLPGYCPSASVPRDPVECSGTRAEPESRVIRHKIACYKIFALVRLRAGTRGTDPVRLL